MKTTYRQKARRVLSAILLSAIFSQAAFALTLGEARSQNLIKETSSGYITAVKPSAEVNALVKKVNAGRKAEYQKIAKKRGTPLSAVEQLAGQRLSK